ncbi:MAG: TRIC cation channel family protein [Candidatus Bathyarchaeia archaeon]
MTSSIVLFTVSFSAVTIVDLLAASTNAFNGGLLARKPNHYRNYTVVGIILLAMIGGIGGGVARDVLLNKIPAAFTNPWYIFLCVLTGILALSISFKGGQEFTDGVGTVMAAFSLPWYAVVGADAALKANLPVLAAIVIGIIGPTTGRYFIDITSGVTPQHFVKGEWFVGTAVLASVVYIVCYFAGLSFVHGALVAFAIAFTFRMMALLKGWEEPEPYGQPKTTPETKPETLGAHLKEEFGGEKRELDKEREAVEKATEQAKGEKVKARTWLPFVLRGVLSVIIASTILEQFFLSGNPITEFSVGNFPIYLGFYFLMNGILTFKEAHSSLIVPTDSRKLTNASLVSIIGGLFLLIAFPFSSHSDLALLTGDVGRLAFAVVVVVIGLLQIQGSIYMTQEPRMRLPDLVFGFLEILLGLVVLAAPVGAIAGSIAFVWLVLVAVYMFIVAHRLHSM